MKANNKPNEFAHTVFDSLLNFVSDIAEVEAGEEIFANFDNEVANKELYVPCLFR